MSLSDPQNFYRLAGKVIPWILGLALVLFVVGFYLGFFVCPVDARQGNSYRIIFIHVSAAWLSMLLYVLMAVFSAIGLWRNNRICFMLAQAMAPTGALMAFIALFSGAFWGRPTWGTYWVWDARLTSELILFFLYRFLFPDLKEVISRDTGSRRKENHDQSCSIAGDFLFWLLLNGRLFFLTGFRRRSCLGFFFQHNSRFLFF